VEGKSLLLPLTQIDLGDALGLSSVHVNRTLQDLRKRRLLSFGDKRLTILNLPELEALAGFDETYLHLKARYQPGKDTPLSLPEDVDLTP
jgi:hypothetical protein